MAHSDLPAKTADAMVRRLVSRRSWTYDEIGKAFEITPRQIGVIVNADLKNRRWTEREAVETILAFIDRKGHWPRTKDYRNSEGMPTRDQMLRRLGGWRQSWPEIQRSLQTYIANNLKELKVKPTHILAMPNLTIRRAATTNYGLRKFIKDAKATKLDESAFGILWSIEAARENVVFVEVVNATPEPGGKKAHYFLNVPPTMTTAQQAVAWTFGIERGWETFEIAEAT